MSSRVAGILSAALVVAALEASLGAQAPIQLPSPISRVSMPDAVRLTLDRNQALRAQRLTIDEAKADEITAALKPNVNVNFGAEGFPLFSPDQITPNFLGNEISYSAGLGYTFERGGKRKKRMAVAEDTTEATRRSVADQERQLRFQAEQAFITALLAKSTLDLSRENLASFSKIVEVNRQRVQSGDLANADFYKISLQKLQFEQDVSAAEVGLVQAKANLRQLMGFETVPDDFELVGDLGFDKTSVALDDLKQQALINRPDVLAAQQGVKVAEDSVELEKGNRARDITTGVDYTKTGPANLFGVAASFDLPFRDRNQGNIAKAEVAVQQAHETETATRFTALTDVVNAYAAYDSSQKVIGLYQSGYLDQAKKSLDISTYVYQHGAGTILDLLDAEQTYRDTQLAYRQALATYMTSVRQINFAVGKQVIP
jgi:cobalt-zinc-cadmium efflux system outer membrane protein